MAYLPHTPRNFREIVLADLLRAQRLILRIEDEIDPQFRIASPEGDWWIVMTLSDDLRERERQMRMVARFMAWKLSPAFTLASEIVSPDAVYCIGVLLAIYKRTIVTLRLDARLGTLVPAQKS